MQEVATEKRSSLVSVGLMVMVCISVIIVAFAFGAAYSGIQSARLTAARASLGQLESTFQLAEMRAEQEGLAPPSGSYQNVLRSYDNNSAANLTNFEKAVLNGMLDAFGPGRDFDFEVSRYSDSAGEHTYVYYFPYRGRVDKSSDLYFLSADGFFTEYNGG